MIAINGQRNVLVRLFAGTLRLSEDGQRVEELEELPPAEVSAVYFREDTSRLIPDLLVVDTPNLHEFFAWCSTYLPYWSPLSAGMQIVERRKLRPYRPSPVWDECPPQLLRGLVCVALGELFFEWQLTSGQTLPNVLSLRSTFGFAATSAAISGRTCLNDLLSKWSRAQHLLQLPPRRLNSNTLKNVWSPLFALATPTLEADQPNAVVATFADIIADDSYQQSLFRHQSLLIAKPKRREHLVVDLENFIRDTKLVHPSECLEAAMIASKMSASPMSHFDVLSDMANGEPRTLLWYSFLSGMLASEPASPLIENMLYRVQSDLRYGPSTKPDIILDELEALIGPHGQIPIGIGIGARFINVELERGVCATFRLRHETPQSHLEVSQLDGSQLFDDLLERLRELFQRTSESKKERKGRSSNKQARRRRGP